MADQSPATIEFYLGDETSARGLGQDLHEAGYFIKAVEPCADVPNSRYHGKRGWCVQADTTREKRAADRQMLEDLAQKHGVFESYPPG